jgi:hypothetical protein
VAAVVDAPRRSVLRDPLVLACCGAWFVPVVIAVVRAISDGWFPVADRALIAVRARDVLTEHHPLLGTAASAALGEGMLTNHPGPLLFDLAALPVRLFGSGTGLVVAVAAINFAAGVVAAVAAARQGGRTAAVATTFGLALLVWSAGNSVLTDPYNPTVSMIPFFAVLVLAWAAANGDRWALPWLVAIGTFCVQSNLAYVVTTVPIVIGALGVYVWRRRGARPGRDLLVRCLPVAVILWAQPIIEQLIHGTDGNVTRLLRASGSLEDPLGAAEGTRHAAAVLSRWPAWTRGNFDGGYEGSLFEPPPSLLLATLSLVALILVLAALSVLSARRLGDRPTALLLGATGVFVVLGWMATARIPLSPFYGFLAHFVRWLWPIGVLTVVAVGLLAGRLLGRLLQRYGRRPIPYLAGVALLAAVAIAVPDGPETNGSEWDRARPTAVELARAAFERLPESGVVVDFRPPDYPPFAFSLVAALQEHGTPFSVTDGISVRQFGDGRASPPHPSAPVVFIAVGFEAIDAWDDAVACASPLDDAQLDRLRAARSDLSTALAGPGFTLSDSGARFADSAFAPPWMASVPDGIGDGVTTVAASPDLALFLADGLVIPPPQLADVVEDYVVLRDDLENNTACVVERA